MKKTILIILVIIWMGIIFLLSSFNGDESAKQSGFITKTIANAIEIVNPKITYSNKIILIQKLQYPVRKIAHITEYFILSLLVSLLLKEYKLSIKNIITITLIICIIYASTDEIHQLLISKRSGKITDVLIDSIGIIAELFIFKIKTIKHKNYSHQ